MPHLRHADTTYRFVNIVGIAPSISHCLCTLVYHHIGTPQHVLLCSLLGSSARQSWFIHPPYAPRFSYVLCAFKHALGSLSFCFCGLCPREESNLHQELRSLLFYPLNYGDVGTHILLWFDLVSILIVHQNASQDQCRLSVFYFVNL